jgi:hypothetical protein
MAAASYRVLPASKRVIVCSCGAAVGRQIGLGQRATVVDYRSAAIGTPWLHDVLRPQ